MAGAYVMMRPRVLEDGEARGGHERSGQPAWKPTTIRSPQQCEHAATVCTACLPQWERDYVLRHNAVSAARLGRPVGVNDPAPPAEQARYDLNNDLAETIATALQTGLTLADIRAAFDSTMNLHERKAGR